MYPEALGVALRVAKHSGTILTSSDTVWDNLKKIEKNRFFPSIFLKLSQTVSSDAKMVPKCFATLKATPKVSGHILGSFEKKIFKSTFRPSEANFRLDGYSTL